MIPDWIVFVGSIGIMMIILIIIGIITIMINHDRYDYYYGSSYYSSSYCYCII